MAREKLRVRRLTLAPPSGLGEEECADGQDQKDEEERFMLDKERMARTTEIAITAGQRNTQRAHVHGVEQLQGSKFWDTGNEDDSSEESETEEATPTLIREALEAGFTIEQLRQAEAELETPSPSTPKVVRTNLKEDSMAKQIVGTWITNRRKNGKPWTGPLPPPRKSPLRTLGDALAKARVVKRRSSDNMKAIQDRRHGSVLPECSSVRTRYMPSPTEASAKTSPRLDQMASVRNPAVDNKGGTDKPATFAAERRSPAPAGSTAKQSGQAIITESSNSYFEILGEIKAQLICSGQATTQELLKSNFELQEPFSERLKNTDSTSHKGRHMYHMVLDRLSTKPVMGYQPTPGLVHLFSKTGTTRRSPNHTQQMLFV
jgi:hypothetical protein